MLFVDASVSFPFTEFRTADAEFQVISFSGISVGDAVLILEKVHCMFSVTTRFEKSFSPFPYGMSFNWIEEKDFAYGMEATKRMHLVEVEFESLPATAPF